MCVMREVQGELQCVAHRCLCKHGGDTSGEVWLGWTLSRWQPPPAHGSGHLRQGECESGCAAEVESSPRVPGQRVRKRTEGFSTLTC